MKSKLGTWSTGGKSADAGGTPIRKDKPKKLKFANEGGMNKFIKPSKAKKKGF